MESLSDTKVLKFRPDTLEAVRKNVNLELPKRIVDAVDILENWVKTQPHFNKRDFSRAYLEAMLIAQKGLVERAKVAIDKLCTLKTLMPEFYTISDAKKDFSSVQSTLSAANLPQLTKEHYRVFLCKIISEENLNFTVMFTFYKYLAVESDDHVFSPIAARAYLEAMLIAQKGLVERAKVAIDKLCTLKTLMPEFYTISDAKKDFSSVQSTLSAANLPQLTKEHYRVFLCKIISEENLNFTVMFTFYKYLAVLCEYFLKYDYSAGFVIIMDYSEINILSMVTKVNPVDLQQIITLMRKGYGMRIKGIHVITPSKTVGAIVTLLKQVFSEKVAGRIHIHETKEAIYEIVEKNILPADYGGEEKSLKDLHNAWIETVSSKEFMDYYNEMTKANTNESYRQVNKFNENYISMPGSFRALSVD